MAYRIEIVGSKQAQAKFKAIATRTPQLMASALVGEAEPTMTLAKSLTPVATGTLRSSGQVEAPHIGMSMVTVEMGFHTSYAAIVHEDLSAKHPVGQAKYLETAVNQRLRAIEVGVAAALKAALA